MFRFNLCLCFAVIAGMLAVASPAQAAVSYSEDFEGAAGYPTNVADVAFGFSGVLPGGATGADNNVTVWTGINLGTNVALLPSAWAHWYKNLPGLADDLITLQYDGYVTGLGIGGEGMVGLQDPSYRPTSQNSADRGVFVGIAATKWKVYMAGLTQAANRITITDGGSPGNGSDFLGATNVPVTVKTVIDRLAGANGEIRVDILKRSDLSSLNPTFTIALTAFEQGNIANLDWAVLHWNDDWSASDQMVEIDNLSAISTPEPSSILLLGIAFALTPVVLRRRLLS